MAALSSASVPPSAWWCAPRASQGALRGLHRARLRQSAQCFEAMFSFSFHTFEQRNSQPIGIPLMLLKQCNWLRLPPRHSARHRPCMTSRYNALYSTLQSVSLPRPHNRVSIACAAPADGIASIDSVHEARAADSSWVLSEQRHKEKQLARWIVYIR